MNVNIPIWMMVNSSSYYPLRLGSVGGSIRRSVERFFFFCGAQTLRNPPPRTDLGVSATDVHTADGPAKSCITHAQMRPMVLVYLPTKLGDF